MRLSEKWEILNAIMQSGQIQIDQEERAGGIWRIRNWRKLLQGIEVIPQEFATVDRSIINELIDEYGRGDQIDLGGMNQHDRLRDCIESLNQHAETYRSFLQLESSQDTHENILSIKLPEGDKNLADIKFRIEQYDRLTKIAARSGSHEFEVIGFDKGSCIIDMVVGNAIGLVAAGIQAVEKVIQIMHDTGTNLDLARIVLQKRKSDQISDEEKLEAAVELAVDHVKSDEKFKLTEEENATLVPLARQLTLQTAQGSSFSLQRIRYRGNDISEVLSISSQQLTSELKEIVTTALNAKPEDNPE